MQREMTDGERSRIRSELPWFGKRRREGLAEISSGVVEVRQIPVRRAWDINGCRPPCCPNTLLFETAEKTFVYVESWDDFPMDSTSDGPTLILESIPKSKRMLGARLVGRIDPRFSERVRSFMDTFDVKMDGAVATLEFKASDFSKDLHEALGAA